MIRWIAIIGFFLLMLFLVPVDDLNPPEVKLGGIYYHNEEVLELYESGHYVIYFEGKTQKGNWSYKNFRLSLHESDRSFRVIKYNYTPRLLEVAPEVDPDLWNFDDSFKLSYWRRSLVGRMVHMALPARSSDDTSGTGHH